jgi:hypothetical protein
VLRTALFATVHAVCIGVIVLGGSLRAQRIETPGTIAEVSLPGGLGPALAASGDLATPDRAQFLLEFIRRTYDTPFGPKNDPREASLRSLLAELKSREGSAAGRSETLPLPLSVSTWIDVVFEGRATPQTLLGAILQSRSASLLYCALLSLDDGTRVWLEGQPDLIALGHRYPVAFLAIAPGFRVAAGLVRVPGGARAEPIWRALVGPRTNEPVEFLRSLITSGEGRVAHFFGTVSQLTESQIATALRLETPDPATRVDSARRLYSVFHRNASGRTIELRAFTRAALDPGVLVSALAVDAAGRPWIPGTRSFWNAVFSDDTQEDFTPAKLADLVRPEDEADFPWLCEQVFRTVVDQRRRYMMVVFASRRLREVTPATAADAIDAIRGAGTYPALTAALERAHVADVAVFAGAARRAAAISAIADDDRAYRTLAQFQGALSVVFRAASRGGVSPADVSEFVASLSALPLSDRGDYEGRLVCWFNGWLRTHASAGQTGPPATIAAGSAEEVFEAAAGPIERAAIRLLAGPAPGEPRLLVWEGTRYRLDLRRSEAMRIVNTLGDAPRRDLSSAEAAVAAADVLSESGVTRETLRRLAQEMARVASIDPEGDTAAGGILRLREGGVVGDLQRAADTGDIRGAARLAPELRLLADQLLARGLLELAYGVALGQRDGISIVATDAASRHDFGVRNGLATMSAWRLPMEGSDALHRWNVSGALLNLDVALAKFALVRLSLKPPPRPPTLGDADRRTFLEGMALIEPLSLTDADRDAIAAAIRRGRTALERIRTASDAHAIADRSSLGAARRSLLPWVVVHDPERVPAFLSPVELLWLGLEGAPADTLHAWGAAAGSRLGCLCLEMIDRRPWEAFAGRWNSGMLASAFPDLNLRLAELLAELQMPAALLGPILTSATLDFVNSVVSRDPDDRRALVEFVADLKTERVEEYLALLTNDGPLVALGEVAASTPAAGFGGTTRPGGFR